MSTTMIALRAMSISTACGLALRLTMVPPLPALLVAISDLRADASASVSG
jgi:outer membrane lipopolysaccharide assembly protein LptE/RlpB